MTTVLYWKPVYVTMWPSSFISTLKGKNVLTTSSRACVCVCLFPFIAFWGVLMKCLKWLQDLILFHWKSLQSDTADVLHAGRRQSAARNSSLTCTLRSIFPPWSIQNPVDTFAVASSKAVSRSDCQIVPLSQNDTLLKRVYKLILTALLRGR